MSVTHSALSYTAVSAERETTPGNGDFKRRSLSATFRDSSRLPLPRMHTLLLFGHLGPVVAIAHGETTDQLQKIKNLEAQLEIVVDATIVAEGIPLTEPIVARANEVDDNEFAVTIEVLTERPLQGALKRRLRPGEKFYIDTGLTSGGRRSRIVFENMPRIRYHTLSLN